MKFPFSLGLALVIGLLVLPIERLEAQTAPHRKPARSYAQPPISRWRAFDSDSRRDPRFPNIFAPEPIFENQDEELPPLPVPTATPVPTIIPSPSPIIAPSPSIAPTTTPVPSISPPPDPTPAPTQTPAFPVPPPNPAPIVAMPPRPAPAPPSGAPSLLYVQQITPVIEVWRAGALTPELPARRGKYVGPIALPINEVVMVRLQFGLLAIGKSVVVTASGGVILDPPQETFVIQPSADCAVSVSLSDEYSDGAIRFYCEGISRTLILSRFVPETQPVSQRTSNGARR